MNLRILAALSILLLGALAPAQTTLEWWGFGSETDAENTIIRSFIDEWNATHDDVKVEMKLFPTGDYVEGPVLTTAFASNAGPDMFLISPGRFMQYVQSGLAADLSPIFTEELRADLLPAAVDAVTVDGAPYAMPYEQEPVALFYNERLFEDAGLEVPTTWEELLDVAQAFDAQGVTPIVIEPAPGVYQNFTWYPFLWQTGADVVNDAMTEPTFASEGAARALDLWATLIREGYAPRTAREITGAVDTTPFASGDAAMQVVGVWAIRPLQENFPDLDFGVAALPAPADGEPASVYGGWMQMVNARSEHVEAALEVTAWMWAQDPARPLAYATGTGVFSPRRSVTEAGADFYDRPHFAEFRDEILPHAKAEPAFPAEMVKIVSDALQAAMFRNVPGERAAADAQRLIEAYLQRQ